MASKDIFDQRAREAIEFGFELPTVEFKGAGPFEPLKFRIARAAQGLSNHRDGGLIIIGVRQEKGKIVERQGVTDVVEHSYDHETIYEFVNSYASPAIELRISIVEVEEQRFVAISIPPFHRTPTICRKDTPAAVGDNERMKAGDVFIRPLDKICTRKVQTAEEMDELIQRSVERRASELLRVLLASGRIDEALRAVEKSRFEKEVEDIEKYL